MAAAVLPEAVGPTMQTMGRSGVSREAAEVVVDLVRDLRESTGQGRHPTIRAAIALGRVLTHRGARAHPDDPVFRWACQDILGADGARITRNGRSLVAEQVDLAIKRASDHEGS